MTKTDELLEHARRLRASEATTDYGNLGPLIRQTDPSEYVPNVPRQRNDDVRATRKHTAPAVPPVSRERRDRHTIGRERDIDGRCVPGQSCVGYLAEHGSAD